MTIQISDWSGKGGGERRDVEGGERVESGGAIKKYFAGYKVNITF